MTAKYRLKLATGFIRDFKSDNVDEQMKETILCSRIARMRCDIIDRNGETVAYTRLNCGLWLLSGGVLHQWETLPQVNKWLREYLKEMGIPNKIRLVKGKHYFWFIDESSIGEPPSSIYTEKTCWLRISDITYSVTKWKMAQQ